MASARLHRLGLGLRPCLLQKAENQARGGAYHGTEGPLHVSDQPERNELSSAVLQACVQAGIPANPDFNGAQQEGCGYYQTTTNNGRRWSAAKLVAPSCDVQNQQPSVSFWRSKPCRRFIKRR